MTLTKCPILIKFFESTPAYRSEEHKRLYQLEEITAKKLSKNGDENETNASR
jgi:hypothetical protein